MKDFTEITKDENEMLDVYEAICTCKYEYDIEMESVMLVAYKLLLTGIKPKGLKFMLRVVGNINEMKLSKGIDIKAASLAISNFTKKAIKEANKKKEAIMEDKILTEFKFEDFTEYKRHQNENGMNTEFTEYQIGYKLIKVIDGIKDVFEEGLFPALLSIVNKDNNEKCERLANPHELGVATEPVENMSVIDKVTVNGKEFFAKCKQEANEKKKLTFDCPDYAGIVNQDRQKIVDKANARIWKEECLKKANKKERSIMKEFESYTEIEKREFAIAIMNNLCKDSGNEASEELIANWINKIFNKKAFSESSNENTVDDKYKLKLETDLVVTMDGINEVSINGKDFWTKRKQGSIHERLNMMDKKIEILRNEKQNTVLQVPGLDLPLSSKHSGDEEYNYYSDLCDLMAVLGIEAKCKTNNDNIPAKVLATLTPEEIQQINDSRKAQIIVDPEMLARARSYRDAINSDIEEKTTIDTSLTSMDGIYKAVCDACGESFYMKKDQYEYCPYCSRKIKK